MGSRGRLDWMADTKMALVGETSLELELQDQWSSDCSC